MLMKQAQVNGNKYVDMVREAVKDENAQILIVAAKTEADIAELETYEDRQMFLAEVGLEESGVARLIKSAYKLLNLENIFHCRCTRSTCLDIRKRMESSSMCRSDPHRF